MTVCGVWCVMHQKHGIAPVRTLLEMPTRRVRTYPPLGIIQVSKTPVSVFKPALLDTVTLLQSIQLRSVQHAGMLISQRSLRIGCSSAPLAHLN